MWWAKSALLVGIRLSKVPNFRWAKAHPAHPLAASLHYASKNRQTGVH